MWHRVPAVRVVSARVVALVTAAAIELLRDQVMRLETDLRIEISKNHKLQRELNKAHSLLGKAQKAARRKA